MRRAIYLAAAVVAALGVIVLAAQVRDGGAPVVGTAIITGTVVTDDVVPRPLGRAIVTVTGGDLPASRSAITDDDGRFVIRNLPAGRVTITSVKHGYVAGAYGATRPGRPGTPALITAGQTFDATIRMSPAGVVTGQIRDEHGEPIAGLRVFAINAQAPVAPEPSRAGESRGGVETDDRGSYRIFDLAPGNYLIAATPTSSIVGNIQRPSVSELDSVFARLQEREAHGSAGSSGATAPVTPAGSVSAATLAVVFFPGTAVMADATRVKLGRGDVRDGLDFVMTAVPVTTIDGTVMGPAGPLPSNVKMSIIPASTLQFFALASAMPQLSHVPGADGRFLYTTITPGHYTIVVRASGTPEANAGAGRSGGGGAATFATGGSPITDAVYAVEDVNVVGQPVSDVTLHLQPGSLFSGRIAFDSATQPIPSDLTSVRVLIQPVSGNSTSVGGTVIGDNLGSSASVPVRADGSFEIAGIAPGRYRVLCTVPAAASQSWWLQSAIVGNRDALDSSLEVVLGTDVTKAVLTLTDRHSELAGTLQAASGLPAPDYFVIALPVDPSLRIAGSRRLKSTRPGTDGRFSFADLPAGDYLLVALTDVVPNEWQQPEFLAEIAPAGVKVTLGQGEKKTQDLRIGGGGRP